MTPIWRSKHANRDAPHCGGTLHRADYPRKPRSCPRELRERFDSRLSFCCASCRRRTTAQSVRFLGRRVHLALAVVLLSARSSAAAPVAIRAALAVAPRTLARWRQWWHERFPATPLWRAECARFMPPLPSTTLPHGLLARFGADGVGAMLHLLRWLAPVTLDAGRC